MERKAKRRNGAADPSLAVRADWSTGPRTPAWDRLWRAILSDLGPEPAAAAIYPTLENDEGQAAGCSSAPLVVEG